jgi:hypothetical protein
MYPKTIGVTQMNQNGTLLILRRLSQAGHISVCVVAITGVS